MSRKRLLIGLTGAKGSGKSTLATHLIEHDNFQELSFASPIKDVIGKIFGNEVQNACHDPLKKELILKDLGVSARQLMQIIGSELFRDGLRKHLPNLTVHGGTVWIHNLIKRIKEIPSNENIVVSDVRFPNECLALKQLGFIIIKVKRGGENIDLHQSEIGCSFDYEILNDTTVEELYSKFHALEYLLNTSSIGNSWDHIHKGRNGT